MSQRGQRTSFNRTRIAGHLDEIRGVVANTLNGARGKWRDMDGQAEGRASGSERVNAFRYGAVGFIHWLDGRRTGERSLASWLRSGASRHQ
jgi:hypothetical protein